MKITFLGTGTSQGVPVVACKCKACLSENSKDKRLRSSVMIETDGNVFVIDTGPDFRQQMLRTNTENLTAILFTHEHKDHIAGLDDIRAFNYILKRSIDIYARERVIKALKREFLYIFEEDKYPGVPDITIHKMNGQPLNINGTAIIPIEVMHYKLPVFGFRIKDFTYITDANYISPESKNKIFGSKVLAINALRRKKHISHFSLQESIDIMNEIRPECGFFTHISHQLGLHEELNQELPDFISLAYDGLYINL